MIEKISINHTLNDEEKFIIENHFLHNKNNSHKTFKEWSEELLASYNIHKKKYGSIEKYEDNYQIELIWDNSKGLNAMMHIFNHRKFILSNNKLKNFQFFRIDVNKQNNKGQTALMFLSQYEQNYRSLRSLTEIGFNSQLTDIEGKTFHVYFLTAFSDKFLNHLNINEPHMIFSKTETFLWVLEDYINYHMTSPSEEQKLLIIDKCTMFKDKIFNYIDNVKSSATSKLINQGYLQAMQEEIQQVEKIKNFVYLKNTLPENESKRKRSVKI